MIALLEELKTNGNLRVAEGDFDAAKVAYERAIVMSSDGAVESTEVDASAVRRLRTAVFSNLSWVYLQQKCYSEAWEAASQAVALQPDHLKAWMRYVEARRRGGYPFEAFIAQLRHVRPLVRESVAAREMTETEAASVLASLEEPLFYSLGLSSVSEHIELVDYLNGMALVTRVSLKPNEVLFMEKQYSIPFKNEDNMQDGDTVSMVQRYAKKLRPLQEGNGIAWWDLKKQFRGAWPRHLNEVSEDMMEAIAPTLRNDFSCLSQETFDELLEMSLVCRFNGFQSGFFRTCALANHSCVANIAMKYRHSNQTTTMLTVSHIPEGAFLNVKYLSDAHFLMGVGKRREYLRSWLFWCTCERCKLDMTPSAESECVGCLSCGSYTHHPFTPNPTTDDLDIIQLCKKPCGKCSASLEQWSDVNGLRVRSFLTEIPKSSSMDVNELGAWMRRMLEELKLLHLHPSHWMYRVLFFFLCAPFCQHIEAIMRRLIGAGREASRNVVSPLFQSTGLRELYISEIQKCANSLPEKQSPTSIFSSESIRPLNQGSDILNCFVLLWLHVATIYPPYELWAVHRATCQLILIHLLFEPSKEEDGEATLTSSSAFDLLKRHVAYLGTDDVAELMRFFNAHRPNAVDPKSLPATSKLRKILR